VTLQKIGTTKQPGLFEVGKNWTVLSRMTWKDEILTGLYQKAL
jgi:hypothetical protein